jgi:hypothetical protein
MASMGEVYCKKVGERKGGVYLIPVFPFLFNKTQGGSYLAKVVGAYCKRHIFYNTYMIVKHISYSDMKRNKQYFKHRI